MCSLQQRSLQTVHFSSSVSASVEVQSLHQVPSAWHASIGAPLRRKTLDWDRDGGALSASRLLVRLAGRGGALRGSCGGGVWGGWSGVVAGGSG